MPSSIHKIRAAFAEESTAGVAPANWASGPDQIHVVGEVSLEFGGQTMVEDVRTTPRVNEKAGVMVKGTRTTTAEVSVYLTGKGAVTSDGVQVSETPLMKLLEHSFGGMSRSNATTLDGTHTTTSIELTDSTNYEVGQIVGIIDDGDADGLVHLRRVTAKSTDTLTLDEALPFTPANGDKVVGCATAFLDADVLTDSTGAASRTLSWLFQRGTNTSAVQLVGSKGAPAIGGLGLNELPTLTLSVQAANFADMADLPNPTWSAQPSGSAPLIVGPRTKFFFQDYGTTAQTASIHPNELSVETGVEVQPIPAITEQTANFQGLAGWTTGPARPTASFLVTPHSIDFDADFQAETFKVFRLAIQGPEGKAMCITFPRCEISATPVHAPNGEVMATRITVAAHEDTTAIGTTNIARSAMVIGLA